MKRRLSKDRKKKSWVWQHFEIDNTIAVEKDVKWVKCQHPGCTTASLKITTHNTTNMARHLKSGHQLQKNDDDEDVEDIEQTVESKEFTEADQAHVDLK
jgi:hypothetical protein